MASDAQSHGSNDTDLAQHFTVGRQWLTEPVRNFISMHASRGVLDPFAGAGDLLDAAAEMGIGDCVGHDVDRALCVGGVTYNDSLVRIPPSGRLVITNPPYLSRGSATRRGSLFSEYLDRTRLGDVYQLAIQRCLESHEVVVAIVPETFLLQALRRRDFDHRVALLDVVEATIFRGTEAPVLVACFSGRANAADAAVHKGGEYLFALGKLSAMAKRPRGMANIRFNATRGNIGLRAIDGGRPDDRIRFCRPEQLGYDLGRITSASRLMTLVSIQDVDGRYVDAVVASANAILEAYRRDTRDLALAPFMGNNAAGHRRRRLDYATARAILEEAMGMSCPSAAGLFGACTMGMSAN